MTVTMAVNDPASGTITLPVQPAARTMRTEGSASALCDETLGLATKTAVFDLNTVALRQARDHIASYAKPQDGRSAWVVSVTVVLWVSTLLLGAWWFRRAPLNTWWGLALSAGWVVVRSGTHVRAFVIMHDATHGALFSRHWMNTWTGHITGIMNAMDMEGERVWAPLGAAAHVISEAVGRAQWQQQLLWQQQGNDCGSITPTTSRSSISAVQVTDVCITQTHSRTHSFTVK